MGIIQWLDSTLQDARYGLRQLRRTPALALAVVLSLTVGFGANTAIFSLVDAAILKPLPVSNPDALIIVEWTNEGFPPGLWHDSKLLVGVRPSEGLGPPRSLEGPET